MSSIVFVNFTFRIAVVASLLFSTLAAAEDTEFHGEIAMDARLFFESPQFTDGAYVQSSEQPRGLSSSLEFDHSSSDRLHQFRAVLFGAIDSVDKERNRVDIREAYWRYSAQQWNMLLGVQRVFWGVTESVHLVDVINQTDWIENIDQEDKLGQPMLQLSSQRDWGEVSAFVLAGFRERTFPGSEGRFRFALPVNADEASYESSEKQKHIDLALRYSHYFGNWDLGLHTFSGTSREPVLLLRTNTNNEPELRPHYYQMDQYGMDLQYTGNVWLLKAELVHRYTQGADFNAAALGFEYTIFQWRGSDKDLGLLVEYLHDDREDFHPVSNFDDDIFVGSRLAFNDVKDTALLFGVIFDPTTEEALINLEAQTRLATAFTLEVESRLFANVEVEDQFSAFRKDSYVQATLAYHF